MNHHTAREKVVANYAQGLEETIYALRSQLAAAQAENAEIERRFEELKRDYDLYRQRVMTLTGENVVFQKKLAALASAERKGEE